jgi:hypothetical protein
MPPSKFLIGRASSGRLVCAPGLAALILLNDESWTKKKAAGEAMPPSNFLTGPASSGRLVCAPGPIAHQLYCGLHH